MGIVNSLKKRDDKKFKKTERDELIIIPTMKLLNWYKFEKFTRKQKEELQQKGGK